MTALRAEGCGIAPWAMSIKSALRDLLSVPYGMISILLIGSLRSPPPIRLRRTSPASGGQNKAPLCCDLLMKGLLCRPLLSHRSAGERWWRQPPKGECISSPAGRLYGFIQTGAFYNLEATTTTLSGIAAVSRVDGIRLLCPPLTEPYVRFSRIRLLE